MLMGAWFVIIGEWANQRRRKAAQRSKEGNGGVFSAKREGTRNCAVSPRRESGRRERGAIEKICHISESNHVPSKKRLLLK